MWHIVSKRATITYARTENSSTQEPRQKGECKFSLSLSREFMHLFTGFRAIFLNYEVPEAGMPLLCLMCLLLLIPTVL